LRSEECDDVVRTDTENRMRGWGVGFYGYYGVLMWRDCNGSCQGTSDYVTAGNSRLVRGYPCFVENYDNHLQGTNNVTIHVYIGSNMHRCMCNIRELITYTY